MTRYPEESGPPIKGPGDITPLPTGKERPRKVEKGQCPTCQHDLNFLIQAAEAEQIDLPTRCPQCTQRLAWKDASAGIMTCGNCGEPIIDPEREPRCHHCGVAIDYRGGGDESET